MYFAFANEVFPSNVAELDTRRSTIWAPVRPSSRMRRTSSWVQDWEALSSTRFLLSFFVDVAAPPPPPSSAPPSPPADGAAGSDNVGSISSFSARSSLPPLTSTTHPYGNPINPEVFTLPFCPSFTLCCGPEVTAWTKYCLSSPKSRMQKWLGRTVGEGREGRGGWGGADGWVVSAVVIVVDAIR